MAIDPEIQALQQVQTALDALESEGRIRVLQWAASKYEVNLGSRIPPKTPGFQGNGHDQAGDGAREFATFAEFYAAAGPATDVERALVGGYWEQVILGHEPFTAQPVNTALKNLGHPVGNITDALSSLKERKPVLVLQVEKRGKSRQARKSYKLSASGITEVQRMIGRNEEDEE